MTDEQPASFNPHGYVRVVTVRGFVFDLQLPSPFDQWYKFVKADGAVFTPVGFIPWHAIDSAGFSPTPFPAPQFIASMPAAGNA